MKEQNNYGFSEPFIDSLMILSPTTIMIESSQ